MISLAPFAILQRLQPPDKLPVSVRGNGIQRPNEALSVCRSLSQIRQRGETQLVPPFCCNTSFILKTKTKTFVLYFFSTHFILPHALHCLASQHPSPRPCIRCDPSDAVWLCSCWKMDTAQGLCIYYPGNIWCLLAYSRISSSLWRVACVRAHCQLATGLNTHIKIIGLWLTGLLLLL